METKELNDCGFKDSLNGEQTIQFVDIKSWVAASPLNN